ncbi:MAG TPA: GNAT family N-acetyltransferase [Acidimicrobiales bacterium]|nr:GNAT family N-acetyltransferase [Acidimicrobiales bacterium]
MTLSIRAVTSNDDLDLLLGGTLGWPGSDRMAALFKGARATPSKQFVAVSSGRIVGYGHLLTHPAAEGGRAGIHIFVGPSHRGRSVGSALWREILPLARASGLPGIRALRNMDDERSLAIAEAHGLSKGSIRRESLLDLTALRTEFIETAIQRVREDGVDLVAFTPRSERDWEDFYEALLPLHQATPDAAAGSGPPPYETIRGSYAERWQVLLAQRGSDIIGITMAFARPDLPSRVVTYFSGVISSERGRGVATGLKAEHARRLRNEGWRELSTWNMEENPSILVANGRLGFQPILRVQSLLLDFNGVRKSD